MKFFKKQYLLCLLWLAASSIHAKQQEYFYFQFNNEELTDIVHQLAAKKEINIVFPVKSPLTARITMHIDEPFTLDQAWEKLYTLLDLAGYSLIEKDSEWTIVKTDANTIIKEPVPLFISVPPSKIPDSDERIRYIYYLTNLRIGDNFNNTDLFKVLTDMLPDKSFLWDPISNGLVISDKANNIKALMEIITQLDGTTLKESFSVMELHSTNPEIVAKLFDDLLKPATEYKFDTKKQVTDATYFPKNVKVKAIPRTNSLIIIGSQEAIDRIKDFIAKYIDVELESGKSILHVYKLQYMDANDIADVLKRALKLDQGGSGQSTEAAKSPINPKTQERVFDKIIIKTDVPVAGTKESAYYGNNNLIIACRNDDWVRIKSLIERLDQVQPQVVIEVLIANLTLNDVKSLGAISANPAELNFPRGVNIQSTQVGPNVMVNPVTGTPSQADLASSLAGDLMANLPTFTTSSGTTAGGQPIVTTLTPGATVLAIDNGTGGANGINGATWSILQALDLFSYSKVIANPHVIAIHNKQAQIVIGQTRLLDDQTVGSGGGTTVVKLKDIPATYTVKITPRIFTSETPGGKDDAVNLEVYVDIVDFIPGNNTQNARLNRTVETKAVLKNGQILALGGLIDHEVDDSFNGTPILANIPILGWFVKNRGTTHIDSNLTIFIAPTIIEPRLRGGLSQYTKDYVDITKKYAREAELFDSLQDPVTRFFFKNKHDYQHEMDDFVDQDEFKRTINTDRYKSIVDVESTVKEAQASTTNKNAKRIVLTNVNDQKSANKPADTAATSTVCAAQPNKENIAPQPASAQSDPLTANVVPLKENITMAKVDVKKMDRNKLRDQLQKILESEDNPLL
jgi:general secretion pathway protein D